MPQYVLGHQERLAKVKKLLAVWPNLYVTGAGLHGIGIPDCIREGTKVGHQLIETLFKETAIRDS
jgi:oxygen-dependent protoporphyrinogen oxidase